MSRVRLGVSVIASAAVLLWYSAGVRSVRAEGPSEVESVIERGISSLHNFEYEDANAAFRRARAMAPRSVLACWGEAMSYNQTLWRNEDLEAGRQALARLSPTAAGRAAMAHGPKEQALLAAVERLFGPEDGASRRTNYANAMADAYARLPDDPDVAAFYALALLGTVSRSLIGNEDAHDRALAGSDVQRQVAAILTRVLASHPRHPGALHYLIHDYDDPEHARLALPAARAYAAAATGSSHARHMPAHIFLQLGLWSEAATADRAAFAESDAWVKRRGFGAALRNYHALAWLQYELLQLGRYREAAALLDDIAPVVPTDPSHRLQSDLSSMRARLAIETRRWDLLARESNFGNVDDLYAIGVSAARTGNGALAEHVRRLLGERSRAPEEGDLRPAIAIMERELEATVAFAAGRRQEALDTVASAAHSELQLPAPLGLPQPVQPALELQGEMLLETGHAAQARTAFEQALARHANRSRSVLGLARAAAALKMTTLAREEYRRLLANWTQADSDLPELKEARAAVGQRAPVRN